MDKKGRIDASVNKRKIKMKEINPAPYNPRKDLKPDDVEYRQIEGSLNKYGLVELLVWNERSGNLVSGHQRLKVLIQNGCEEVDVSVVNLDPEDEKTLNIVLNKVQGMWDDRKLAILLGEFTKSPTFNIGDIGFDFPEVSKLLDRYQQGREDDFNADAVAGTIVKTITKQGDVTELGKHRIMCGNSSSTEDLGCLMAGGKAHLVHTDPPYNVAYTGSARPNQNKNPKKARQWEMIRSDDMPQDEYETLLKEVFTNMAGVLAPGAAAYIWNGHKNFGSMHSMLEGLGFHVASVIVWAKPNFGMSYSDYHEQVEFCLYGWRKDNGAHKWYGPVTESTLWEVKRDPSREYVHPTQKPVALAQRAIRNSSVRGDIVLDLFLGSGSTLIAAESLGRRCYGMEIDPRYCDAVIQRYINFVGATKVPQALREKYMTEAAHA
ncbi:MAG: DNA modification methylase [Candidatus Omnitrophica bacterium]|nr:DNA modification methylase [Candidatus Omnitrophota bacterium]